MSTMVLHCAGCGWPIRAGAVRYRLAQPLCPSCFDTAEARAFLAYTERTLKLDVTEDDG